MSLFMSASMHVYICLMLTLSVLAGVGVSITSALLTTLIKPMRQRACFLNLMLEFMGFTCRSTSLCRDLQVLTFFRRTGSDYSGLGPLACRAVECFEASETPKSNRVTHCLEKNRRSTDFVAMVLVGLTWVP